MTNTRRKNRWRAKQARTTHAALHPARGLVMPDMTALRLNPGHRWPTVSAPPVLDNFVLRHAAAGLTTIGDPSHRPPATIDFLPPSST